MSLYKTYQPQNNPELKFNNIKQIFNYVFSVFYSCFRGLLGVLANNPMKHTLTKYLLVWLNGFLLAKCYTLDMQNY